MKRVLVGRCKAFFKPFEASGYDQIRPIMLQQFVDIIVKSLANILIAFIES